MEFVQYHPTGLPFTGILITEAARAEGGWLLNRDGYRYLQDYDLGEPEPRAGARGPWSWDPRDRLSQAFVKEQEKGRTIETPYGDVVHLDIRHLGEKVIDEKLPFVRELCLKYEKIDPVREMIPVRPGRPLHDGRRAHRPRRRDAAPGLYAAGEVACVSINGANRLGSNSLTELLVFGARAGRAAAYAARAREPSRGGPPRPGVRRGAAAPGPSSCTERNGERLADAPGRDAEAMEEAPGSTGTRPGSERAADTLHELRGRMGALTWTTGASRSTPSWSPRWSWRTCWTWPRPSCTRRCTATESRGAHQRTDHPDRDDDRFLAHSLAYPGPDGARRGSRGCP
jgi:fumarate reductase flavoprotein subunit